MTERIYPYCVECVGNRNRPLVTSCLSARSSLGKNTRVGDTIRSVNASSADFVKSLVVSAPKTGRIRAKLGRRDRGMETIMGFPYLN